MDGVRTEKNYNGTITSYTLDGDKIVAETKDGKTILYYFDENGTRFGFNYSGEDYYYIFNGQSDVIGIVNSTGTTVVNYTYDSWGKVLSITGSLASTVGEINPIRYRGYYYDSESGLYYLQSRYYDAETCRMVNADELLDTDTGLLSQYMFMYCNNNPVNMTDDNGCRPWWQNALRVAGAVVFVVGVVALSVATAGGAAPALMGVAYAGAAGATTGYVYGSVAGYRRGGWQGAADGGASGCLSWTADFMTAEMGAQVATKLISKIGTLFLKSVDKVIGSAKFSNATKGASKLYTKSGGYRNALKDFNSLRGIKNVKRISGAYSGYTGTVDGITVVVRNGSKSAGATLEFQFSKSKVIKIRY